MRLSDGKLELSASDLAKHLGCRFLTVLDQAAADGRIDKVKWRDPRLEVLRERGFEHEKAYLEHLEQKKKRVLRIDPDDDIGAAYQRTVAAMRSGVDVIAQATLVSGRWLGRADTLERDETPSSLGGWSYQVCDTKLARETQGGTILQLCLLSDIVKEIQGRFPESMFVVTPGTAFQPEKFRVLDFMAYYRHVREALEKEVDSSIRDPEAPEGIGPEPVPHCERCSWWPYCRSRWEREDHLSLVAGISKLQREELQSRNIKTLTDLARLPTPLPWKPDRGSIETYEKVREQARIQLEGRTFGKVLYEILPLQQGRGLGELPEPSPGDIFFDIEGDSFVGVDGLEYLFGYAVLQEDEAPLYECLSAWTPSEEKAAFEAFVDFTIDRLERFPDLHIYHYGSYEPSTLKRLMGRYATRENEIDRLLRGERFVDLLTIVKRSIRASVESYSIKELEPLYEFDRSVDLREARVALHALESALEMRRADIDQNSCSTVLGYNRDDAISTLFLRNWLEQARDSQIKSGASIPRPERQPEEATPELDERARRAHQIKDLLTKGIPVARSERTPEEQANWLLAQLLEWHRREAKATWWEFFRMRDLDAFELAQERRAIAGLDFLERVGGTDACPIHRYSFPEQDIDIRPPEEAIAEGGDRLGAFESVEPARRWVDIRKKSQAADSHPTAAYAFDNVPTKVLEEALLRLGEWVTQNNIDSAGFDRAGRDLLLRRAPRLRAGVSTGALLQPGESTLEASIRLSLDLSGGVLAVQGPPGSGKTYTAARMICALVSSGKRVGVAANSHKVIRNLLEEVLRAASKRQLILRCLHKVSKKKKDSIENLSETTSNKTITNALAKDKAQVIGGTSWLWARPDLTASVDILVIDEAGQFSLANALAISGSAENLVLLGDPQQLDQPLQGSHPDGAQVSALEHLLGGEAMTVAEDKGLFLGETWRLCPEISRFISEMFYEDRLVSEKECAKQRISGPTRFQGAGLWYVPVEHQGNQTSSSEEVDRIVEIYKELIQVSVQWTNRRGESHVLTDEDILIVAPYNAQVGLLGQALPQAKIGTVDKFQGQGEAVVIYSLTTSTSEEAPRGMDFLYSANRFNVAVSRAKCSCIIVGSPRLFAPACTTPQQMRLANSFCRYLEICTSIKDQSSEAAHEERRTPAEDVVVSPSKSTGDVMRLVDPRMERVVKQVLAKMVRLGELYYHLVLAVGPSGSGKTPVLREVARQKGVHVTNLGLELSERLLDSTDRQRGLRVRNELDDLLGRNDELVVLDNTEILFHPALQQDPLQLLQKLSRTRIVVASWNGVVGDKYLTHAAPEHPEYKRYSTKGLILVNVISAG